MDYSKIKVLGDKVIVRISSKSIENIYSKEITRDDGTKVTLFKTVPAGQNDDRQSELFVTTGEVINKGPKANVKVGDILILSYEVFNDDSKFIDMDGDDKIIWVHSLTTYHDEDFVAYGNRRKVVDGNKSHVLVKDNLVWKKGEVNELSQVLGIVRGDEVLANDPYVFLNHESAEEEVTTTTGIVYKITQKIITRSVLAVSHESVDRYGIYTGAKVTAKETDTFAVKLADKTLSCINDQDVIMQQVENKLKAV